MGVRGEEDGIINQIKFVEMLWCYLAEDCIELFIAFYFLKIGNICTVTRVESHSELNSINGNSIPDLN